MISFALADVKSITSAVPISNFAEADIETLANLILECNGIIQPIIIKQIGIESYTVIAGHLEYYAALRAKQKDLRKAEQINVFVLPKGHEEKFINQISFFQNLKRVEPMAITTAIKSEETHWETALNELKSWWENKFADWQAENDQEREKLAARLAILEEEIQVQKPIEPLTITTNIVAPKTEKMTPLEMLNTLSQSDLIKQLQQVKVANVEKLAKNIYTARQSKPEGKFTSYRDAIDSVTGLGDKTMLAIIDDLSS